MSVAIPRNNWLKRAESAQRSFKPLKFLTGRKGNSETVAHFVPKLWLQTSCSSCTGKATAISSAPTGHTVKMAGGPALPGGPAYRDAGQPWAL